MPCLWKSLSFTSRTRFASLPLHHLPLSLLVCTSEFFCADVSLRGHQRRSSSGEHLLALILFTSSNSHCPHSRRQNITQKISGFDFLGIDVQRDGSEKTGNAQNARAHTVTFQVQNIYTTRTGTNTSTHKQAHTLIV